MQSVHYGIKVVHPICLYCRRVPYEWQLSRPSDSLPIGILNAGATCYLNSLIQAFFFIPSFRELLQNINLSDYLPDETESDAVTRTEFILKSSTLALQKVFYLLEHSRVSVNLNPLLTSFGWNLSDIHQQVILKLICDS